MADLSKILILGSSGMVGSALDFGIKLNHQECDITNPESIQSAMDRYNPTGILCLSSLDLRVCEEDPLKAYNVNVLGVHNLALEAKKRNISIIIISSGTMFSGSPEKIFSEEDIPEPLNIYGQTKYLSELLVQKTTENHIIIRTGWLFGGNPQARLSFIDKMFSSLKEGKDITATMDQFGSPTLMQDYVQNLKGLIETDQKGTFCIVNQGSASAAELMKEAAKILNSSSQINEAKISDFSSKIKRSPSEALKSSRVHIRPWKKALKEYLTGSAD